MRGDDGNGLGSSVNALSTPGGSALVTSPLTRTRRAAPPPRRPKPRMLFYSYDSVGLGHVRRMVNLASELGRRSPDAALVGIVSAFVTDAHELPANFDWIKLPLTTQATMFQHLPATGSTPTSLTGVNALRQAIVSETFEAFAPQLVLTDFMPSGGHGELRAPLACLRGGDQPVRFVLGLRDVIDSPENVRRSWRDAGEFEMMEQVYDRILVYGDPDVFDMAEADDLPPAISSKMTYCGYLHRAEPLTPPDEVRARLGVGDKRLVVVTTGGGHDGEGILRTYISALQRGMITDTFTLMTLGPIRVEARAQRLERLAEGLPDLLMTPFISDFLSYVNAADAVVTMGGSTVVEIVSLGKRPIIVPRVKPWQEQMIRAERLSERGLATWLHPDKMTPGRLAQAVNTEFAASPPTATLKFTGLQRAGEILADLLD